MPKFWKGWEEKDLNLLNDYLLWLARENIHELIILDDNISLRPERFIDILHLLRSHAMSWSAPNGIYARSLLDQRVLKEVLDSGCLALSLPFEAGNPRSAKIMGLGSKYLTFDEATELVRWLRGSIKVTGFFIIGYPGETEDDVRETLDYANALPLHARHIYFATPYIGTRLHDLVMRKGYLGSSLEEATYKTPVISTPWLSRERLYEIWMEDRKLALEGKEGHDD